MSDKYEDILVGPMRKAQEGHVKMTVYANQLEHKVREQAEEIERLKSENVTLLADVDDLTTVKRLRSELAAERERAERLEKALRYYVDLSDGCDYGGGETCHGAPGLPPCRYHTAREALRAAASDPTPSCGCPVPDCQHHRGLIPLGQEAKMGSQDDD